MMGMTNETWTIDLGSHNKGSSMSSRFAVVHKKILTRTSLFLIFLASLGRGGLGIGEHTYKLIRRDDVQGDNKAGNLVGSWVSAVTSVIDTHPSTSTSGANNGGRILSNVRRRRELSDAAARTTDRTTRKLLRCMAPKQMKSMEEKKGGGAMKMEKRRAKQGTKRESLMNVEELVEPYVPLTGEDCKTRPPRPPARPTGPQPARPPTRSPMKDEDDEVPLEDDEITSDDAIGEPTNPPTDNVQGDDSTGQEDDEVVTDDGISTDDDSGSSRPPNENGPPTDAPTESPTELAEEITDPPTDAPTKAASPPVSPPTNPPNEESDDIVVDDDSPLSDDDAEKSPSNDQIDRPGEKSPSNEGIDRKGGGGNVVPDLGEPSPSNDLLDRRFPGQGRPVPGLPDF